MKKKKSRIHSYLRQNTINAFISFPGGSKLQLCTTKFERNKLPVSIQRKYHKIVILVNQIENKRYWQLKNI